jgi:hypothetical protein
MSRMADKRRSRKEPARPSSGKFENEEPPTSIRDFSHLDPSAQRPPAISPRVHGRLDRSSVPVLAVDRGDLLRLAVDHRAGFLLSQVDGETSIEGLLDLSAMPEDETLGLLRELLDRGILVLR